MVERTLRYARAHPLALVLGLVALVALAAAPSFLATYYVAAATRIVIMGTFAVAFNIVFGLGGMPSLGHAAFFGTGGYVVALGLTRWDWGFGTVMAVVLLGGAALGLVFGVLSQRLSGIYLLLMTLALAQAVWGLAFQMVDVTGGDTGISGVSRDTIPFPVDDRDAFHYFALVVCLVIVALLWGFARSPVGRAIDGMHASATRMSALGYNIGAYKLCAFLVSGVASALTGALFAYQQGFVGVETLDWTTSATVLLAAIIGGARHFLGPALGMGLLIIAETVLSDYTDRWTAVLGLLYIITILVLPEGVLGVNRLFRRKKPDGDPAAERADAALPTMESEVARSSTHG
jgi:branched-chain amino acid transport system permease protein